MWLIFEVGNHLDPQIRQYMVKRPDASQCPNYPANVKQRFTGDNGDGMGGASVAESYFL